MAIVQATEAIYDDIYATEAGEYNMDIHDKYNAMVACEEWVKKNKELYIELCKTRGDYYTSDREVQALGYVLKDLMLVSF